MTNVATIIVVLFLGAIIGVGTLITIVKLWDEQ